MQQDKNYATDIAIIGMSGIFPEAEDIAGLYENLKSGRDGVRPMSDVRIGNSSLDMSLVYRPFAYLDRIDLFDHKFFRISKSEAEMMEPSQRLILEMAIKVVEQAGYRLEDLSGTKTAVYLASRNWAAIQYYLVANFDDNPNIFTGTLSSMIYGRVSNLLNLQGPTMMIDAACASSLIAVTEACEKLIKGEVDYAIAGGVGININLMKTTDHGHLGTYSSDARCKTFDASADGVVPGEGGGLVLLKRLEDAIRDGDQIQAVIKGGATLHNGSRSNGIMAPSPEAQAQVIQQAWKNAGVEADTIGYIETHGTGTKLGDPIEFSAITDAFNAHTNRRQFCAVSAIKSNIGHLGSGAGIAGIIKGVLSLKNKQLFPSLHFKDPNPFIDFENTAAYVNTTLRDWEAPAAWPRRCGVSAFGLSGTNAHVVMEEFDQSAQTPATPADYVLKIAAKTPAAFKAYVKEIYDFLAAKNDDWSNALYTLNRGRSDYNYRYCFSAASKEELLQQLADANNGDSILDALKKENTTAREIVLLLGNGGYDDATIGQYLHDSDVFKEVFSSICPGYPQREPEEKLKVFAAQYATCRQLQAYGIKLPTVIGTGIGKLTNKVLTGELAVTAIPALLLELNTDNASPDKDKFKAIVKDLQQKKAPVFLELGSEGSMTAMLQEWATALQLSDIIWHSGYGAYYNLQRLFASLYNACVATDWERFYAGKFYQKVDCPTYPFQKVRCWYKEATQRVSESVSDWYYDLHWTTAAVTSKNQRAMRDQTLLVFADEHGITEQLTARLEKAGNKCVVVMPGEKFEMVSDQCFRVNYLVEQDYRLLENSVNALYRKVDGIIYLSSYFKPEAIAASDAPDYLPAAFYGLFHACKTFNKNFINTSFNIAVVTANVHAVTDDDTIVSPFAAMAPGMIKASLAESYTLRVTCMDVDFFNTDAEEIAELLHGELTNDEVVRFVAYRDHMRYAQELNKVKPDQYLHGPYYLEPQGAYLITGGHSGIGYEMARALAVRTKANLIIVGRTALPAKTAWHEEGNTPAQLEVIRRLEALEDLGATVQYHSADLSNAADMDGLFATLKKQYSRLAGVVHSAGIGSSGISIAKRNTEGIRDTFAPKVTGSLLLEAHTRSLDPKFFVVFSSIGSLVPASSSADYTVANVFQDAFAASWHRKGRNFISINWPDWKETGLSFRKTLNRSAEEIAQRFSYLEPIATEDGINAFFRALEQREQQLIVVKADFRNFIINPYFKIGTIKKENGEDASPENKFNDFLISVEHVYTPMQVKVAKIWHEVLKLESVSLQDDFYELGGHSLNIIRMLNRIEQQLDVTLPVEELLQNSTLEGVAASLDKLAGIVTRPSDDSIVPAPIAEYYPLSHAQQRFWMLHQIEAGRDAYNVPSAYRFKGPVDVAALDKALEHFISRHESLRTVFVVKDGVPVQKIRSFSDTGFALQTHDLRGLPEVEIVAAEQVRTAAGVPFDLANGPLIRAHLFQLADQDYIFLIVLHHITSDGRSMEILRNEVLQCYKAAIAQQEPALAPLPVHYKDYAVWQHEKIQNGYFNKHSAYWKERLLGLTPLSLEQHFDFTRGIAENYEAGYTVFFLPANEMAQLKGLGNNSTLFINTLLIFQLLLSEYTGQDDVVVGTPVGGREHTDLENQVGIYLNTMLLRTEIDKSLTFVQLLDKVKEQVFKDYMHQAYPFDMLVDELKLRNGSNAFDVGFTWNTRFATEAAASGLGFQIEEFATGFNKAKSDLWLHVTEMTKGLQIGLLYKRSLFREDTIQLMSKRFYALITQCIQNPGTAITALDFNIATNTQPADIAFDFNF